MTHQDNHQPTDGLDRRGFLLPRQPAFPLHTGHLIHLPRTSILGKHVLAKATVTR